MIILCQRLDTVRAYFEKHPVPFPVGIDQERSVARAFGVYRLLGFDSVNIARPATFVVDGLGVIRERVVGAFQWRRMPLPEILRALDALRRA